MRSEHWSARLLNSVQTGIWAQTPVIVVVLLFYLAVLGLLDGDDHQVRFAPGSTLHNILSTLPYFLGTGAFVGAIWLVLTRSRGFSLAAAVRWIAARNWAEIVLLRPPLAFALIFLINYFHLSFKVNIPAFGPYDWDHAFVQADRILFFGYDPWVLTHGILSDFTGTIVLDSMYHIWFLVLQFCVLSVALLPFRNRLRGTFLLAYSLNWAVGGVALALAMPAVGPVYLERLTGDPTFQPLMDLLHQQAQLAPIRALEAQEWLWDGLTDPNVVPFGVSAFPSLHVEMAATCALFGFRVSRVLGAMLAAFTVAILVGSVHLGWHYAIDGVAGILLAVFLWRVSARVTAWWLARTEPGGLEAEEAPSPVAG